MYCVPLNGLNGAAPRAQPVAPPCESAYSGYRAGSRIELVTTNVDGVVLVAARPSRRTPSVRPANGPPGVPAMPNGGPSSSSSALPRRGADVRPEVVLEEVVVVRDAPVGRGRVVLVELGRCRRRRAPRLPFSGRLAAAPGTRSSGTRLLPTPAYAVLVPGVLAREEQLAALVEEVADVDHLLDGEARRAGAGRLARLAGQVVVARVPDHRVVVAEHAEGVRRRVARGVDVVDVVARRRARRARRCSTSGSAARRVLRRRAGGVVLGRQDQHLVAASR